MPWPQIIVIVWLILSIFLVPANAEAYVKIRYRADVRLIRAGLLTALLWWGGFFI